MTDLNLLDSYLIGGVIWLAGGLGAIAFAWLRVEEDPIRYRDHTTARRLARGGARLILATPIWPIASLVLVAIGAWHTLAWTWDAADLHRKDTP